MVEHSPEAIKIVRRYARVTPGTAQRMLDALLEQGGPDSLGDETAPTGRTEVTYQGLTHECQDPLCHVPGFVETLPLVTPQQPVDDEPVEQHNLRPDPYPQHRRESQSDLPDDLDSPSDDDG